MEIAIFASRTSLPMPFQRRISIACLIAMLALTSIYGQEKPARKLNYYPEGRDIVCLNGNNRYTRALYGGHSLFRLETSDRPIFATYDKNNCKNISLFLSYGEHSLRLDSVDFCEARYQGGRRYYTLTDSRWDGGTLTITVLARTDNEGAIWKFSALGFKKEVIISAKLCPTIVQKMERNGDLGIEPRLSFEPNESAVIQTLSWKADGETYLILTDNEKLHKANNDEGRRLYDDAESARKKVVERVEFTTPDPYINTLGANLCAAADGTWDGTSWQHGAIGWRVPLAGWRGAYVGDALGWYDRQESHFGAYANSVVTDIPPIYPQPAQDSTLNLARAEKKWGTPMYSNGYLCRQPNRNDQMNHYDMNLVFFDALLRHFCHDADTTMMRKMWPFIKLHLEWEKRNWDADNDHLYDAYCCIWASDALFYNGGAVTHSSAYNYQGNRLAARIAEILGEDPTPYKEEAEAILNAMDSRLWLENEGHWAEYQDFMGNKRLHNSAAIWSIYTPIECGACSPLQAWRATAYVDRNIPHIPVRIDSAGATGITAELTRELNELKLSTISTSNWLPYDWSINNVAHEEMMNMALAYFEAGKSEEGYALLMSDILDGMFLGQSPGNFGQISYYDKARSEAYRDFADNVGISSQTFIQGLFGIQPDALYGRCIIKPAIPNQWDSCLVRTPYLSYKYHRTATHDVYEIEQNFKQPLKIIVRSNKGEGSYIEVEGTDEQRQTITIRRAEKSEESATTNLERSNSENGDVFSDQEYLKKMGLLDPTPGVVYQQVDISSHFNSNISDIFHNEYLSPRPPYTTLQIPKNGIGQWCHPMRMANIDDSGLRARVAGGQVNTGLGFSFLMPQQGYNIAYTSLWDNYPDSITIPITGQATAAWLLMAGSTNHMQSRIDNALVTAFYTDGSSDTLRLENPINWCPIEQVYYTDGLAFKAASLKPYRMHLGTGVVSRELDKVIGFTDWDGKVRQNIDNTEAHIIDCGAAILLKMPLNPSKKLKSITLRTLSCDVVAGISAITLELSAHLPAAKKSKGDKSRKPTKKPKRNMKE